MIPQIRDVSRANDSQRMPLARARHAISLFALLLLMISNENAAARPRASQDSSAKPAPTPAAQQTPSAPSKPSIPAPGEATPLQKAVHQKKVLTEEDLAKPSKAIAPSDFDGEENNPLCDPSCEADLRAQMGFGPEREAEFRNQMTLARHDIGDDHAWNSALQSTLEAAGRYCDLQRQKAQILSKGAVTQYMRDDVNFRFTERERKMILDYGNSAGLLKQRIQAVQRFAPFRASVMEYQVREAAARVCPDFNLP
jgi:hypothetical protein